jgi:hypothetical protein
MRQLAVAMMAPASRPSSGTRRVEQVARIVGGAPVEHVEC